MTKLFFSYSHRDEELRNELETHLAMLKRQNVIEAWHDRRITAGQDIDHVINQNLEDAGIILLLVSPQFLASNYCYDIEMQHAMQRHADGTACVIPVILRPCDWHDAPFGKLLATPTDGKPVTKFANQDDAFLDVVKSIKIAAANLRQTVFPSIPKEVRSEITKSQISDPVRSSNLRIRKTFSDQERHHFLDETFEYIANFFENSLKELSERNAEVDARYKRIDANHFSAFIYVSGKTVAQCKIWLGGSRSLGDIVYSSNASSSDTSMNESMSLSDDGYALYLRPMGIAMMGTAKNKDFLSQQGASEYFWTMLIRPLQGV